LRPGSTAANTKATTRRARKTVKGNILGKMAVTIPETGSITRSLGLDYTYGPMAEPTRGTGSTTKCTVEVLTPGKMAESMKVSTSSIRNTASAHTHGKMDVSMSVSGRIASDMVGAKSFQ
jgi:hypothetical protein